MKYFTIPNFRAIETKADASGQDRTVLRKAEGVVSVPSGALGNGPTWKPLWGLSGLSAQIETALLGANSSLTHLAVVEHGDHTLLVAYSLLLNEPVGIFHVSGSATDTDFDGASGVTITVPAFAQYRNLDGNAPWFMSVVGGELWFGNGIDPNTRWTGTQLLTLAPVATTIYKDAQVAFPACTCFAVSNTRHVFAAGNAASPLRVWIAESPSVGEPTVRGVHSLDMDFVDITLTKATRITGISVWQNYVTVHTDQHPVNLFGVNREGGGWKAEQQPSPANSSAPNPNCAVDARGSSPFYLGSDAEVYKDEATRTGPYNKHVQRDVEIVTAEASGSWNTVMLTPVGFQYSATIFDRGTRLFWMFARMTLPADTSAVWVYNDRNDSISGPFRYPDASVVCAMRVYPELTVAVCITAAGDLLYSRLSDVAAVEPWETDDFGTALGSDYEEKPSAPTPDAGVPYVGLTADGKGFGQVLAGNRVEMATPWKEWTATTDLTLTRFFNNGYVGVAETGYLDLGSGDVLKNFLEIRVKWRQQCRAYVGIFGETERGLRSGKWFGSVYGKEDTRMPINLRGQRIRVRVVVVWFNDQRAELRELAIGFVPVGDR